MCYTALIRREALHEAFTPCICHSAAMLGSPQDTFWRAHNEFKPQVLAGSCKVPSLLPERTYVLSYQRERKCMCKCSRVWPDMASLHTLDCDRRLRFRESRSADAVATNFCSSATVWVSPAACFACNSCVLRSSSCPCCCFTTSSSLALAACTCSLVPSASQHFLVCGMHGVILCSPACVCSVLCRLVDGGFIDGLQKIYIYYIKYFHSTTKEWNAEM
jgi:hypothetical protein